MHLADVKSYDQVLTMLAAPGEWTERRRRTSAVPLRVLLR